MTAPMHPTAAAILRLIEDCAEGDLPLPTNRQIGEVVGISSEDWVAKTIRTLAQAGLIRILVANRSNRMVEVVATGKVTAKRPPQKAPPGFKQIGRAHV